MEDANLLETFGLENNSSAASLLADNSSLDAIANYLDNYTGNSSGFPIVTEDLAKIPFSYLETESDLTRVSNTTTKINLDGTIGFRSGFIRPHLTVNAPQWTRIL